MGNYLCPNYEVENLCFSSRDSENLEELDIPSSTEKLDIPSLTDEERNDIAYQRLKYYSEKASNQKSVKEKTMENSNTNPTRENPIKISDSKPVKEKPMKISNEDKIYEQAVRDWQN
jgi:hypothetical protein